jgi:hypothetical protein
VSHITGNSRVYQRDHSSPDMPETGKNNLHRLSTDLHIKIKLLPVPEKITIQGDQ